MSDEKPVVNFGVSVEDRRDGAAGVARGPLGGLLITGVKQFSSAAKAGLQVGDEIVALGNDPVSEFSAIVDAVNAAGVGAVVKFSVMRQGAKLEVSVRLFAQKELNFKISKVDKVLERKIAPR